MTTDKLPEDATHELQNVTTHEVSLVDKPANKKPFLIVKSAKTAPAATEPSIVEQFAQNLAALGKDATTEDLQNFVFSMAASVGIDKTEDEDTSTETVVEDTTKTEEVAPAVETDEQDDTLAKLDNILDGVEGTDVLDSTLEKAHIDSLTAELSEASNALALAKAELEAYQVSAAADREEAVAKALTEVQEEHTKAIEAKDAEIAELTTKLAGQAKELAKAEKRLGAAPQAHRVSALLKSRISRAPSADSQIVPAGEQNVEKTSVKDPWKAVELDLNEDSK